MDRICSDYIPQTQFLLQKYLSYQSFGQGEPYLSACRKRKGRARREARKRDRASFKSTPTPANNLSEETKWVLYCGFRFCHFVCSFSQVISCLEKQIRKLREELIQANALRDQQLLDLSLQCDEEKLKAARDKEAALNSVKMEMEKVILDLKKKHMAETEAALNKVRDSHRAAPRGRRGVITPKVSWVKFP